jgi:hypothetical protein
MDTIERDTRTEFDLARDRPDADGPLYAALLDAGHRARICRKGASRSAS